MVLPLLLLPPLDWWTVYINISDIHLDTRLQYQKQTLLNRFYIKSANKIQILTVPIERKAKYNTLADATICYKENWMIQHRRSIESAYRRTSYYEYFADDIFAVYQQKPTHLMEFNMQMLYAILQIIQLKDRQINFLNTAVFEPSEYYHLQQIDMPSWCKGAEYYQPFGTFAPNLSILDLLFNNTQQAVSYLMSEFIPKY